jgi:hypothetical protein
MIAGYCLVLSAVWIIEQAHSCQKQKRMASSHI